MSHATWKPGPGTDLDKNLVGRRVRIGEKGQAADVAKRASDVLLAIGLGVEGNLGVRAGCVGITTQKQIGQAGRRGLLTAGTPLVTLRSFFFGQAVLYDWKVWSFWQV